MTMTMTKTSRISSCELNKCDVCVEFQVHAIHLDVLHSPYLTSNLPTARLLLLSRHDEEQTKAVVGVLKDWLKENSVELSL